MAKKSYIAGSEKETRENIRGFIYFLMFLLCSVAVYFFWVVAGLSLCGISGCSGGGFGVSYDPGAVQGALIASGIAAAIAPFLIFFISKFKRRWLITAITMLIIIPVIGAAFIGAGLDGYPINYLR